MAARLRGAVEAYRRALDLHPGDAMALTAYASFLSRIKNRPEVERLLQQAVEIEPLVQLPRCNYKDWPYAERKCAEAQARKTRDLDPNWFCARDQQYLACAGKTGEVSWMKEPDGEGLASHADSGSCSAVCEDGGEAVTGAHTGRV